jgi:hypothetical protein
MTSPRPQRRHGRLRRREGDDDDDDGARQTKRGAQMAPVAAVEGAAGLVTRTSDHLGDSSCTLVIRDLQALYLPFPIGDRLCHKVHPVLPVARALACNALDNTLPVQVPPGAPTDCFTLSFPDGVSVVVHDDPRVPCTVRFADNAVRTLPPGHLYVAAATAGPFMVLVTSDEHQLHCWRFVDDAPDASWGCSLLPAALGDYVAPCVHPMAGDIAVVVGGKTMAGEVMWCRPTGPGELSVISKTSLEEVAPAGGAWVYREAPRAVFAGPDIIVTDVGEALSVVTMSGSVDQHPSVGDVVFPLRAVFDAAGQFVVAATIANPLENYVTIYDGNAPGPYIVPVSSPEGALRIFGVRLALSTVPGTPASIFLFAALLRADRTGAPCVITFDLPLVPPGPRDRVRPLSPPPPMPPPIALPPEMAAFSGPH